MGHLDSSQILFGLSKFIRKEGGSHGNPYLSPLPSPLKESTRKGREEQRTPLGGKKRGKRMYTSPFICCFQILKADTDSGSGVTLFMSWVSPRRGRSCMWETKVNLTFAQDSGNLGAGCRSNCGILGNHLPSILSFYYCRVKGPDQMIPLVFCGCVICPSQASPQEGLWLYCSYSREMEKEEEVAEKGKQTVPAPRVRCCLVRADQPLQGGRVSSGLGWWGINQLILLWRHNSPELKQSNWT